MESQDYLKNLSNQELTELVDEIHTKTQFSEDSPVTKAILAIYGKINIMTLQVNQLAWPLTSDLSNRIKNKN
jgi:hypothetical protein